MDERIKRSRKQERGVAKATGGSVNSGSGNGWMRKNDVRTEHESFELKTTKSRQFTVRLNELQQANRYAILDDRMMVFGIEFGTGDQYFVLSYDDYMMLRQELGWYEDPEWY